MRSRVPAHDFVAGQLEAGRWFRHSETGCRQERRHVARICRQASRPVTVQIWFGEPYCRAVLDVHRLTLLREVMLRGSMTAAARELSYSHSAVSQQLALLEKEAGTPLLEKVGRNVRLTPAGEDLVRNTEAVLVALERAESDLAAFHERPQGVFRLIAFTTISRSVVLEALKTLARDYPQLDVRLQTAQPEDAVPRLVSRQVDAVLTDAYPGTESISSTGVCVVTIGHDPVRAYLPVSPETGAEVAPNEAAWVMEPPTSAATHWALRVCREHGFEPRVVHESSDLLLHLRMVEQGLAAAFLPDLVIRESASRLIPSTSLPTDQYRTIHFLVREGTQARQNTRAVRSALSHAFQPDLAF